MSYRDVQSRRLGAPMGRRMGGPMGVPMVGGGLTDLAVLVSLFSNGEAGALYAPWVRSSLYEDSAGTTLASVDGPVGYASDQATPAQDAVAPSDAARPTYRSGPYRLEIDKTDDNLQITIPTGGWTGTMIIATTDGTAAYGLDVDAGTYDMVKSGLYFPGSDIVGFLMIDRVLTAAEESAAKAAFVRQGAAEDYSDAVDLASWYRGRNEITTIDDFVVSPTTINLAGFVQGASSLTFLNTVGWDTANVQTFGFFARDATSLTTLDVSGWDTSSSATFVNFIRDATSLTTLDVSGWDTSSVESFVAFARGASALTSLDVSNWDTSKVNSFLNFANGASALDTVTVTGGTGSPFADSAATDYTNAFSGTNLNQQSIDDILVAIESAATSNGTFGQSGGSAPSATGETAIDALRARGWTVTVTGGY